MWGAVLRTNRWLCFLAQSENYVSRGPIPFTCFGATATPDLTFVITCHRVLVVLLPYFSVLCSSVKREW